MMSRMTVSSPSVTRPPGGSRVPPDGAGPVPASPPASRRRARWWRDPRLAVGVVLVAVAALLGAALLGGDDAVGVWSVRTPVTAGAPVGAAALVRTEVRFVDQAQADRYLSADAALPTGLEATRDLAAGELLPRSAVAGEAPTESVEVPLSVPAASVPSTLAVGSTVDVWVTADPATTGQAEAESTRVLEGVAVVALDRADGFTAGGERQVIVAVDPAQETELPGALATLAAGEAVLVRTP